MTPPTEPAPVHNPERPNSLVKGRNRSSGQLHRAPQQDARPPPAAIEHSEQVDTLASDSEVESEPDRTVHITSNVEELFHNLPSTAVLEEQDVLDLTTNRKVIQPWTTPEFEARLREKAPELLEQLEQFKQDRELLYRVNDILQKKLKENRQLREMQYLPLPDSKKLTESMKMRKNAEVAKVMSPSSLKSASFSQRYVKQEVDRIDGSVASPTSPGPSPLRTSASQAEGSIYSPPLSDKFNTKSRNSKSPKSPKELRYEGDLKTLEVRVKLQLLPAITLLSKPSRDVKDLQSAYDATRKAWKLARTRGLYREGAALMGMCEYYIGLCRLAQSELLGGHDRGKGAEQWFAKASVNAAGFYAEAELAEKALEAIRGPERPESMMELERPRTAGSIVRPLSVAGDAMPGTAGTDRPGTSGTIASLSGEEAKISTFWGWRRMLGRLPHQLGVATGIQEVQELREEEGGTDGASPPFTSLDADTANTLGTASARRDSGGRVGNADEEDLPRLLTDVQKFGMKSRFPSSAFVPSRPLHVAERAGTPDSRHDRGNLGVLKVANGSAATFSASTPPGTEWDEKERRTRSTARTVSAMGGLFDEEVDGEHSPPPPRALPPPPTSQAKPLLQPLPAQTPPGLIRLPSSPTQSPGGTPSELPTSIPSPVTSPTGTHHKRKSVAFTLAALGNLSSSLSSTSLTGGAGAGTASSVSPQRSSPQTSPTSISSASLVARRLGKRLSSVATGSQRADSYRDAEEGRSPYRATFGDVAEEYAGAGGRDGVKGRKKSAEEMV